MPPGSPNSNTSAALAISPSSFLEKLSGLSLSLSRKLAQETISAEELDVPELIGMLPWIVASKTFRERQALSFTTLMVLRK